MKNFELTGESKINEQGITLFRIRCTHEVQDVKVGDLGGWIEKEENLSGNAWIYDNAEVWGNIIIHGNAKVYGNAKVFNNLKVLNDIDKPIFAEIVGDAQIKTEKDYCIYYHYHHIFKNAVITVFRDKDNILNVKYGCVSETFEKFKEIEDYFSYEYGYEIISNFVDFIEFYFDLNDNNGW